MDYMLGEIILFPYNFVPAGFALCNGATMNIAQNQALFSLLGTTYGGDGRTTFALPNLQGAEPNPNVRYYIATQGLFPMRQ